MKPTRFNKNSFREGFRFGQRSMLREIISELEAMKRYLENSGEVADEEEYKN